ncbi:DNA polymerase beta [Plakobranchus ocellatus]|uniref:DNA polymerase beta n=1 Tax=Plakobranchus ocellatus TaxID=259542 RepID=A0AAV4CR77_9GAST|nr:DNA polymerase beta [Plakobranchus ocellatus]
MDKAGNDNKSNQCNPNNPRYQGHQKGYQGTGDKADLDNHGQQLNPNNPKYQETLHLTVISSPHPGPRDPPSHCNLITTSQRPRDPPSHCNLITTSRRPKDPPSHCNLITISHRPTDPPPHCNLITTSRRPTDPPPDCTLITTSRRPTDPPLDCNLIITALSNKPDTPRGWRSLNRKISFLLFSLSLLLALNVTNAFFSSAQGTGDKADLDNHGQQLNPNNPKYQGGAKS